MKERMRDYTGLYILNAIEEYFKQIYEIDIFMGDDTNDVLDYLDLLSEEELISVADNIYDWKSNMFRCYPELSLNITEDIMFKSGIIPVINAKDVRDYLINYGGFYISNGFIEFIPIAAEFDNGDKIIVNRIYPMMGKYKIGNYDGEILEIDYFELNLSR